MVGSLFLSFWNFSRRQNRIDLNLAERVDYFNENNNTKQNTNDDSNNRYYNWSTSVLYESEKKNVFNIKEWIVCTLYVIE